MSIRLNAVANRRGTGPAALAAALALALLQDCAVGPNYARP